MPNFSVAYFISPAVIEVIERIYLPYLQKAVMLKDVFEFGKAYYHNASFFYNFLIFPTFCILSLSLTYFLIL